MWGSGKEKSKHNRVWALKCVKGELGTTGSVFYAVFPYKKESVGVFVPTFAHR